MCKYKGFVPFLRVEPSGPPQGSRARPRSSTSIEVFWQPPLETQQNGNISGYNIMYTPIRDAAPMIMSVDGSKRSAMLTGLRKFTKYTIWVAAKNSKGEGPSSNKFELYTDEDGKEVFCDSRRAHLSFLQISTL